MPTCTSCGDDQRPIHWEGYCHACCLTKPGYVRHLESLNQRLRRRLAEQTNQTQRTASEIHRAVAKVLNDRGVVPDGLDLLGHPIEQVVAACLSSLQCQIEQLRAQRDEWRVASGEPNSPTA